MPRETRGIRIPRSIDRLLERTHSQRRYFEASILRRWKDWQDAFKILSENKWTPEEIRATFDALQHFEVYRSHALREQVRLAILDGIEESMLDIKWDCPNLRQRANEAGRHEHIAWSLETLNREWWDGNLELEAKMERM